MVVFDHEAHDAMSMVVIDIALEKVGSVKDSSVDSIIGVLIS